MKLMRLLLFFLILGISIVARSQPCTSLGQTPASSFPVCGTATFVQTSVPICAGQPLPGPCGPLNDKNPYWYRFRCYVAGTLGFLITPNVLADDYDWQLFDVTGRNPNDVYTDASLFVCCNWSGLTGVTGASSAGASAVNCGGGGYPLFSSMPNLIAGHDYLLMISHWTNTQSGYQLTFTGGTAVLNDPANPTPQVTSAAVSCDATQVTVRLNKKVKCASLSGNGTEFSITPAATIVSATGGGCVNGFDLDSVRLTLNAPLAPGNYTVTVANGSDGNTLLDNCDVGLPVGDKANFTVVAQTPLSMGTVSPPPCAPTTVTINFPEPVNCSSIAPNGSDFLVTGPAPVNITGAAGLNCVNGQTTSIAIRLANPVLISGTYTVHLVSGTDGNTLSGNCNRLMTAGQTADFAIAPQPPVPLGTVDAVSCAPSSVTLSFTTPLDCTSVAPDGSDFVITGPSNVVITGASGQCNVNPNLQTITINLSTPINVSGTYRLEVRTGTDGNTIRGDCFRYVSPGDFTNFTVPDAPYVPMDSIVPVACSPASLRLIFSQPIRCSSIAPDGSDFILTGPAAPPIASAAGTCDGSGLTKQVDIQLSTPIVLGGLYQLQLRAGTDGNTIVSECFRLTPAASQVSFMASDTVSASFQYAIQYDCANDIITFTHNGLHGVNQWAWQVNGSPANTTSAFSRSFSAASINDISLTVSNGLCSDTHSEQIILDNKLVADFTAPDMICPEDSAVFKDLSTGSIATRLWTFGNGNSSTTATPPAQRYPLTGLETNYLVNLTIANATCHTSASKYLKVFGSCNIAVPTAFTPNNDGLNDYLFPVNAYKADNLEFKVFNRWGQLVFYSRDWTKKWDGRINGILQSTGTYVWMLNYVHRDTKVKYALRGTSTLIR